MRKINIAFCIRDNYEVLFGGDVVQMLKTKEYLEKKYNISITILADPVEISEKFDLIHLFNFSTYKLSRKFIEKALEKKIPVVSSPIYWDYSYASTGKLFYLMPFLNHLNEAVMKVIKQTILIIGKILSKPDVVSSNFKRNAKWMFHNSNIVAPNSLEEAELLMKWIKINDSDKIRVVYNATDISDLKIRNYKESFHKRYKIPIDYILQVGRIEYCKNQLNLLSALKNNPQIPLVFLGKIVDNTYYKKLKKIADKRGNVYFIEAVAHEEISDFYQYAKLHVLLSLRESPGLVNIEALANECPIVISDKRFLPVNTYFHDQPYIVNPLNISQIRKIVLSAYEERKLVPFDLNKFSWDTVAEQTFNIYREVLRDVV